MTTKREKTIIPSDALFKKFMSQIDIAKEFLSYYLPKDFKFMIALDSIKVEKESYVEDSLKKRSSDLVYSVKTKDGGCFCIYFN